MARTSPPRSPRRVSRAASASGAAAATPLAHGRATWLKVKARREQELVVIGYEPGRGSHADLGSLLLATHESDGWRFAGHVGSGMDAATRAEWRELSRAGCRGQGTRERCAAFGERALHRATPRDPCRVRRVDARRAAAAGGVPGSRPGPGAGDGLARATRPARPRRPCGFGREPRRGDGGRAGGA